MGDKIQYRDRHVGEPREQMIGIRVTSKEMELLKKAAAAHGMTVSRFMIQAAIWAEYNGTDYAKYLC